MFAPRALCTEGAQEDDGCSLESRSPDTQPGFQQAPWKRGLREREELLQDRRCALPPGLHTPACRRPGSEGSGGGGTGFGAGAGAAWGPRTRPTASGGSAKGKERVRFRAAQGTEPGPRHPCREVARPPSSAASLWAPRSFQLRDSSACAQGSRALADGRGGDGLRCLSVPGRGPGGALRLHRGAALPACGGRAAVRAGGATAPGVPASPTFLRSQGLGPRSRSPGTLRGRKEGTDPLSEGRSPR